MTLEARSTIDHLEDRYGDTVTITKVNERGMKLR